MAWARAQVRPGWDDAPVRMAKTVGRGDLASRWTTSDGEKLAQEIFGRLRRGDGLDDLHLGVHDGRVDLRGIRAPSPERLKSYETGGLVVAELGGLLEFQSARLADLDFSGGRLESFRFFNSAIDNCRFDDAICQDWRLWAVDITNVGFIGADLRNSVLGSWYQERENIYRRVNFSAANLRSIVSPAATFIDCDFGDAKLAKVDFQSSSFIRCRFAGLLREVMFYDHGFKTGKPDPNPMEDVDFSEAELRMVEFRRLDLDRVRFPTGNDHIVVLNYRCVLERAVRELKADDRWKGLRVLMEHSLKWAGPRQEQGVFNRRDLVEMADEAEAEFAVSLLHRLEAECATS
jgi:uncharacterized protein YjbI with pentapeptide repeats